MKKNETNPHVTRREITLIHRSGDERRDTRKTFDTVERSLKLLAVLAIPVVVVVVANLVQSSFRKAELERAYLELAVGILKTPVETPEQQALKEWAAHLLQAKAPDDAAVDDTLVAMFEKDELVLPTISTKSIVPFQGDTGPIFLEAGSIVADPNVEVLQYDEFVDIDPSSLWRKVNEASYWAIPRDPPAGYYNDVDGRTALTLQTTLNQLLKNHTAIKYTTGSSPSNESHVVDVWDVIALGDAHPQHPDRVLDVYLNQTFDRQLHGTLYYPRYDREFVWPKSFGLNGVALTDCHNIFAAYSSYNGSRSNRPYGENTPNPENRKVTFENLNRGGSLTDKPNSSNYSFGNVWQVWIGRRGDIARAIFYMAIRYDGGLDEPDLRLTDDLNAIYVDGPYMGLRSVLVKWHLDDPVDDIERRRNTVVYLFQRNRNPFIDHPEWVLELFSSRNEEK